MPSLICEKPKDKKEAKDKSSNYEELKMVELESDVDCGASESDD